MGGWVGVGGCVGVCFNCVCCECVIPDSCFMCVN